MGGDVLSQFEIDRLLMEMGLRTKEEIEYNETVFQLRRVREIERENELRLEKQFRERRFWTEWDVLYGRNFVSSKTVSSYHSTVGGYSDAVSGHYEDLLSTIVQENKIQGMGNYKIPNTQITLINYSVCPKCKTVFTYKDLVQYYSKPKPSPICRYSYEQYRSDSRVHCHVCNEYFLPALVIVDGTPRNEVQLLNRDETVNAIQNYYFTKKKKRVLTSNPKNIVRLKNGGERIILNDVRLIELNDEPTLICNLIEHTPINLVLNMLDGSNIQKKDALFGGNYF